MQTGGGATEGLTITKMPEVLRTCAQLQLSSSVVASAATFMLNEDQYQSIIDAIATQCMARMEQQERQGAHAHPFALLKIGFIFRRSFNQGIHIPTFIMDQSFSDRFGLKQDLSETTARALADSDSTEGTDVEAIAASTGLSAEQVTFAIENVSTKIGQLAIEGAFMVLDFGVGTLVIAQHTAEFEFSQQQPEPVSRETSAIDRSQPHGGGRDNGLYGARPPRSPRHGSRRAVLSPRLDLNATTVRPAYAMTGDPTSPPPSSQQALAMTNGGLVKHFQGGKPDSTRERTASFEAQMKLLTTRVSAVVQSARSGDSGLEPVSGKTQQKIAADAPGGSTKLFRTAARNNVDFAATRGNFSSAVHEDLGKSGKLVARSSLSETWSTQLRGCGPVILRVCKPFGPSKGRGPAREEKEMRRGKALLKELRIARIGAHANLMRLVRAQFLARSDSIVKDADDRKKRSAAVDWWWCTMTLENPKSTLADMVQSPVTRQAHFGSVEERRAVTVQLVGAVHHLHEKLGIAHRSLTTANVLTGFGESCPRNARYRLGNFSTAQTIGTKATRKVGKMSFRPPELVSMHESQVMVRAAHDVWAIGAILFEVLVGGPLMSVDSSETTGGRAVETEAEYKAAYQGIQAFGRRAYLLPRHAMDAEVDVLEALLHDDHYQRPTTLQLCDFEFLRSKTVPPTIANSIDFDKIDAMESLEDVQETLEKEVAICEKLFSPPPENTSRGRGRSTAPGRGAAPNRRITAGASMAMGGRRR